MLILAKSVRGFGKYGYSAKMDFIKDKVYTDEAYFRTNYSSRVVYQKV